MVRKRSKLTRYNPDNVKALRAQMLKCPNPIYGQMVTEGQMSDGDMMDFALSLANSYFGGELLASFKTTAKANMELQTRRAVLVTAALFGATAAFDKDGMNIMSIFPDEGPDLLNHAVQQLVDVGMSVAEAMQVLQPPAPIQCQIESDVSTQLPEIVEVVH